MDVPLVEPAIVPDAYISGLAYVDQLEADNFRLTFFTRQRSTYDGNGQDLIVVSRHVVSREVLLNNMKKIRQALGLECCGGERMMRMMAH